MIHSRQEASVNSITGAPYSQRYKTLLDTRKKLPVYGQMDGFYKAVGAAHIIVIVA